MSDLDSSAFIDNTKGLCQVLILIVAHNQNCDLTHLLYFPDTSRLYYIWVSDIPIRKTTDVFFVTTSFTNRQSFGKCPGLYEEMAKSLSFCQKKYEAAIAGYVFMPSHLHLLTFIDGSELSNFMRDFKKYISQKAKKDLGIKLPNLWMPRFDRVAIESRNIFILKLKYIHNNPIKAGLVKCAKHWRWSSAGDYFADKSGPISVYKEW